MKRLVSSIALAGGFLLLGIVNASASGYCSLDPTLNLGTPLTYSLNVNLNLKVVSTHVYVYGTKKTTTFGGGLGIL